MPEILFNEFSGGLWLPGEPVPASEQAGFAIPPNALLQADNLEFDPSGALRGRRGRTRYNAAALSGAVTGLFRHYPRAGQNTQGPILPDNGSDVAGVGTEIWQTPAEIVTEDGTSAKGVTGAAYVLLSAVGGQVSHYLRMWGFTFTLPVTATITGIQLDIKRRAEGVLSGHIRDFSVRLRSGVVYTPRDLAYRYENWPRYLLTDATGIDYEWISYGGPTELWGMTWGPAEFNAGLVTPVLAVEEINSFQATAHVDCAHMWVYFKDTSTTPIFIGSHVSSTNHVYVSGNAGVFSAISGGTMPDPAQRPRFVNWPEKNKTFLFDGLNAVRSFNGAVIEIVQTGAAGIAPHRGPYATLWKDRLFAADPDELNYSVYATTPFDETDWPPNAQVSVNDPQGGAIAGLIALGDRLVILKETSLWSLIGDIEFGAQLVNYSDQGCVAPDTVQRTPFGIIFLGRDGLYLSDGVQPVPLELSRPIRSLFVSRTTETLYPNAIGVYFPRKDQYWLKLDPAAADAYVLQRLLIPTSEGQSVAWAWSHIPTVPMNAACVFESEQDLGELFLGDLNGTVWEADAGGTDDGAPISFGMATIQRLIDRQGRRGRVYHVKPVFRSDVAIDVIGLRYDQVLVNDVNLVNTGTSPGISQYQEPRVTVTDLTKFGRFIGVTITQLAAGPEFELHALRLDVMLRSTMRWV